jgi:hypothetical protein
MEVWVSLHPTVSVKCEAEIHWNILVQRRFCTSSLAYSVTSCLSQIKIWCVLPQYDCVAKQPELRKALIYLYTNLRAFNKIEISRIVWLLWWTLRTKSSFLSNWIQYWAPLRDVTRMEYDSCTLYTLYISGLFFFIHLTVFLLFFLCKRIWCMLLHIRYFLSKLYIYTTHFPRNSLTNSNRILNILGFNL